MVAASYATFPCPACGNALPATMPAGLVIACYHCRASISVPLGAGPTVAQAQAAQAWGLVHGTTAAALADARAPGAAHRLFASTSVPVPVDDGAGGVVVVGAQVAPDGTWRLRGVDPATRQIRWEALHGGFSAQCPEVRSVCGRGGRIYVAHEGRLTALDASTGRAGWQAPLGARLDVDVDGAPRVGDESDLREIGDAIVVRDESEAVQSYDRERGTPRWRMATSQPVAAVGAALLIATASDRFALMHGATGETLARIKADAAVAVGGGVLAAVDDRGPEQDQAGVAFVDGAGAERWFAALESPDLDPGVAELGGALVIAVNRADGHELVTIPIAGPPPAPGFFARLFGARGLAARRLPWPKHNLTAMWAVGDALVIDAGSFDGARRIAILDGASLAVRHDSGPIPDGVAPGVRLGPGVVAYAYGESNGPKTLRVVDPRTGAATWERILPDLDDVAFRAGRLVLRTDGGPIELVEIATGRTLVSFQE